LDNKELIGQKISKIISDIKHLEMAINRLVLFAQNIDTAIGYSEAEQIMENVSRLFSDVYYSVNEFAILNKIAEVFFEFHLFFADYKNLDELTPKEVEELLSIEFILIDIKEFVDTIFVSKTSDNIFIYEQLFKSNLEQIELNIQNAEKGFDEFNEGELDFF
jgi:hypothetical protein